MSAANGLVQVYVAFLCIVLSAPSFSKIMIEQGSGRFVNVIVPSGLNWNEPIRGWGILAKESIKRDMPRKRFCLRRGSSRCFSHVLESTWPISGPICSSSIYAVGSRWLVGWAV